MEKLLKQYKEEKSNLTMFKKEILLEKFNNELEKESYYESNKIFYQIAISISILAQIGSIISSFSFFEEIIKQKIKNETIVIITSLIIIVMIEIVKYNAIKKTLKKIFAKKYSIPTAKIILCIIICGLSTYASVNGAKELTNNNTNENQIKSKTQNEINNIKNEIKNITQKSDFKQIQWANGQAKELLTQEGKNLITKKENQITEIKNNEKINLNQNKQKENKTKNNFQLFFAIFETLFLIANIFIWHFKKNCVIEQNLENENQNQTKQQQEKQQEQKEPNNKQQKNNEILKVTKTKPETETKTETETETEQYVKNFMQKLETKKAKYLEKYLPIVKLILENKKNNINDTQTKNEVIKNYGIKQTTYYVIKRICES